MANACGGYIVVANYVSDKTIIKMKIYKYKTLYFKKIFLIAIFTMLFSNKFLCHNNFAKSIDINGIKVSITIDVISKKVSTGTSVKEENKFSDKESADETNVNTEEGDNESEYTETSSKNSRDEYVKVSLSIRNNNPYESANVTITEIVNRGFKQVETNKLDKKISFKLESNKEKTYKYNYKYSKHTLLDQIQSMIYGDGSVDEIESNDNEIDVKDGAKIDINDNNKSSNEINDDKSKIEDNPTKKKDNTFKIVLIVFVVLILGVTVFIMFLTFIQSIRDKDVDFGDSGGFKSYALFLISTLLISMLYKNLSYAADYTPIMYQKGESFTKTIKETILFNDRYFEFSYEISIRFDNKHEITDYETDTDGDGLVDALEYLYMTNINDKDSDGDGLSDYLEVMVMNYNPNSKWTFNDGRNDGYRDYDEDGLRNKKEIELGTDPTLYDTDGDNLDDYEEVNGVLSKDASKRYGTDPLKADTDEDGLSDDVEIKLGLDPTKRMTDGVTLDSERKIHQDLDLVKLSSTLTGGTFPITAVSGNISGLIEDGINIKVYSNANFENTELIIGSPLKVELKEESDRVKVSVDCSNYGGRVKKLMFVKYKDNGMTPISTTVNGSEVSAELGNGEYGMIDCEMYLRKMNIYLGDYD